MRIGLFGGSFNPPHRGHVHATELALKRVGLDRVWWLVSPGNPLKETRGLPPLASRMEAARAIARDPRIVVTGLEAEIGTRYTYDTVAYLRRRCPGVRFVWIMGADILSQLPQWQRWRGIAELVPFAVIDRPGATWPTLEHPCRALAGAAPDCRIGGGASAGDRAPSLALPARPAGRPLLDAAAAGRPHAVRMLRPFCGTPPKPVEKHLSSRSS